MRPSPYADEAPGGGLLAKLYTRRWLSALGVVAIGLVLALLATSIAVFTHAFADPAHVTMQVSRAGSQLSKGADVKLNGVIVGRVASITASSDGATLDLAIDHDRLSLIPADVTAQVVPKTIFGEKYVDLVMPAAPSAARLAAGAVIPLSRTSEAIETRTVLNDLGPLLDAVSPADLETTLTNIATAIRGRGDELGQTIDDASRLTAQLAPTVPLFVTDAGLVAQVSDSYSKATGPLFRSLTNLDKTAGTLTRNQKQLAQIFSSAGRFADVTRGFVKAVGNKAVQVVQVSRPVLDMVTRYSPEIACLIRGITLATDRLEAVFADGPYLKAKLYVSLSRGVYKPGKDKAKDLDLTAYGPYCPVIPKNGKGTVPWPKIPKEMDGIRNQDGASVLNQIDGLPGTVVSRKGQLADLLMGGGAG